MSLEWIETKLADVGTFERGKSKHRPRDAIHLYGGLYPFIQTGDITAAGGKITNFRQTYNEKGLAQSKLWESNTLCITIAANIAETALLTFPACFPDSVVGFIPDANKADVRFVEYLFRAFRREVKSKAYGSVQENINLEVLRNLKFPIPPLQIQNTIADFLSLFDDRITLLRETNATLEAIAQALFKSWFVDFDPVHAKAQGRQPEGMDEQTAALFPDRFVESELGMVPLGWEVGMIDDVCDFQNGYAFKSTEMSKSKEDTYKIFKMGNIKKGGGLNRSGTKDYFEKAKSKNLDRYLLKKGDLLMCMTDMKNNVVLLGHTALMDIDDEFLVNQRVGMLRSKNKKIANFPFLYLLTNSDFFIADLRTRANSGVQVNLSTQEIKNTKFVLPPEKIHQHFNEVTEAIYEKLFILEQQQDSLADLRDSLLPRLISGQLRLPDVEA
jgi:type I restriction enzyme S subunit